MSNVAAAACTAFSASASVSNSLCQYADEMSIYGGNRRKGMVPLLQTRRLLDYWNNSQTKIIVCQLDDQASGMLAAIIQIIDMTNASVVGRVWIATTLTALSVSAFDHWIDLQKKHALFSFFMQTKRRTQYYDFTSHASMVVLYGKEAFQCSYSSALLSKKVWKKCREKENWEFPPHDVIARILSQDSSRISQIIQTVAQVLSAASSSQWNKRKIQFGYHQPPQIVQPWQCQTFPRHFLVICKVPCASMLMKCPFEVIIEEKEWFHYYKPGDYWITGIMSGVTGLLYQFSFSKPPTHQLK
ncbi:hypothetical protein E2320_023047, partial [Naja naja]